MKLKDQAGLGLRLGLVPELPVLLSLASALVCAGRRWGFGLDIC